MYSNPRTKLYNVLMGNTDMNNAIGRTAGAASSGDGGNFFTKKASSIGNAVGTTLSAPISLAHDIGENIATQKFLGDSKARMKSIANKYGYDSWADWQDAYAEVKNSGDENRIAEMDEQLKEFQAQANANAEEATAKAKGYEDYRQNNLISKNINQDRGKFAGSAINTLSTATDLLGLTNGPVSNAVQGGIEGVADELEQNGLENFSWDRAKQNAIAGAATGAVVGGLNKGLSNSLAKKGGNLFKGSNKLTAGINSLGANHPLAATIATGAGRGALSGAAGGATGAGISAAMNGGDVLGSALQGAAQGAQQGAMAGSIMSGANIAINKTPGVGDFMQKVNQAQTDWENSGENFNERFANTINSGESNFGNTRFGQKIGSKVDSMYTDKINQNARARLANALTQSVTDEAQGGVTGDTKFVRLTDESLQDINTLRQAQGLNPLENRQVIAYENAVNNGLNKRVKQGGMTVDDVVNMAYESLMSPEAEALPGNVGSTNTMMVAPYKNRFNGSMIDNYEGTTSLKSIEPRSASKVDTQREIKNDLLRRSGSPLAANQEGGVTQTSSLEGSTSLGDEATPLRTRTSIIPQGEQNVNTPETEVYRTMAGENPEDLNSAFNTRESNTFKRQNKAQMLGQRLQDAAEKQKYSALYDALDEKTALRATNTNAPEKLAELGFEPENYGEFAKTSNYINEVVDGLAKKSGVKTNLPDLPTELAPENIDVALTDNGIKKYNDYIRQIVADGDSPTQYSAAELLEKSRWLGNKAEKIAKTETGADVAKALKQAKYILRDHASEALDNAGVFGDATDDNVAGGLAKLGFDEKVQDYYTNAIEGKSPTAGDLIRRSSLAEQARDMYSEMGKTKLRTSASHTSTNPLTQLYRSSGLEEPVNAILRSTVAPVAGGLTKGAGKLISGAGDLYAKFTGNGESVAPKVQVDTATTQATNSDYNPATQVYNAIGRREGLTNAEEARTANYLSNAVQSANRLEDLLTAPGNTGSTSVYNSVYGNPSTTAGDYWMGILGNAMQMAMDAGDATAFVQLYSMYQDELSKQEKSSTSQTKLTDKQRQANAAARALADFEQTEPNFAYDVSDIPLIGGIANLGGNEYASKAEALALQIGYMLSGATVNKEEAKNIGMAYVPQPRDNESVRRSKLNQLRGIISDYQQTYGE